MDVSIMIFLNIHKTNKSKYNTHILYVSIMQPAKNGKNMAIKAFW